MSAAQASTIETNDWRDSGPPDIATSQAECDAILAAAREAGGGNLFLHAEQPPLEPTDDIIEFRLAEELEYAQQLLEVVGDRFVSDPLILQNHMTTMQSFDIIGQLLGHLAKVVGSKDKKEAIERIGMHELRVRMKRPTAGIVSADLRSSS
jgi:hypothetical protein